MSNKTENGESRSTLATGSENATPLTTALFEKQDVCPNSTNQDRWEEMTEHSRKMEKEAFRLRVVLEEIARLDTGQLAPAEQCNAVVLAMDALSFPNTQGLTPRAKPEGCQ